MPRYLLLAVLTIIAAVYIVGTSQRSVASAQLRCGVTDYEQMISYAKMVDQKFPLSAANILDYRGKRMLIIDPFILPPVSGCPDEPEIVGESYNHLRDWWTMALLMERKVALIPMIRAGLSVEPPACAAVQTAEVRVELWTAYVAPWRFNPRAPAIQEASPSFEQIRSLYFRMAKYVGLPLQKFGTPYQNGVLERLFNGRGAAARTLPAGVTCGQMSSARRGANLATTFLLSDYRLVNGFANPSSSVSSTNDSPTQVPTQVKPFRNEAAPRKQTFNVNYNITVTNAWIDVVHGVQYVHDTLFLQATALTVVNPSSFVLSITLANGTVRQYTALNTAAPTYQKINPLDATGNTTAYEVDPSTDLGRLGSLSFNGSVTTTVTFLVPDMTATAQNSRNVSSR